MKRSIGRVLVSFILALCLGAVGSACVASTQSQTSITTNSSSTSDSSSTSNSSTLPDSSEEPNPTESQFKEPGLSGIKNVILMIGDGMGPNHVKAAEIYKGSQLAIHSMPNQTYSLTRSANQEVTDSAAGATALATGVRTNNGHVGVDTEQKQLTTIMDVALQQGKRTGIVTTDVMSGATPMAFAGHCEDRHDDTRLLSSAARSGVNLFVSTSNDATSKFEGYGYKNLQNVDAISDATNNYVLGTYDITASAASQAADENGVALDRVVSESIEYLSKDTDGFVLMAEGARIDKEAEKNNFEGMIQEMLAFDDAVQAALNWAKGRNDTVVIVTADHETGGLLLGDNATKDNIDSQHFWSTHAHTGANVYCNVYGTDVDFLRYSSEGSAKEIKNADIFTMMKAFVLGYQEVSFTVKQNTTNGGMVEFDKAKPCFGQNVKITLKIHKNYRLVSFKINDKESITQFHSDCTLDYVVDSREVVFKALFVADGV